MVVYDLQRTDIVFVALVALPRKASGASLLVLWKVSVIIRGV